MFSNHGKELPCFESATGYQDYWRMEGRRDAMAGRESAESLIAGYPGQPAASNYAKGFADGTLSLLALDRISKRHNNQ